MKMKITTILSVVLLAPLLMLPVSAQTTEGQGLASYVDMAPEEMPTHLVKVLRTTNKAQINQYVAKVYDFENVNPNEIANFIANGLKLEEGGIYTFVHPDGDKGKLMVFCPKYQLEWIEQVCKELDRPRLTSAPGSKYIYYRLRHRSAADPAFLNLVWNYISSSGLVWPDIKTNSLLLFDSPSGSDYCHEALQEYLDAPTPQINIDVKIYEIDMKNDGKLGLDYEMWKNGPGAALFATQFTGQYLTARHNGISYLGYTAPQTPNAPAPLPDHFRYRDWYRGYGYRVEYPSAFFDFLVDKGKARVLVNTRLSTCNATPALIRSGDFIPFYRVTTNDFAYTRSVTSDKTPRALAGIPGLGIDMVDTGVYLSITPMVGSKQVNLDFAAKVVNQLGWTSNGEPLVSSFQVDNDFRVPNGKEIVIGGISRERLVKSTSKIPLLGDLPILGWIFGGETNYCQKSVVVVSLTPRVIDDFSGRTGADMATMAKATGEQEVNIPSVKVGFDQYLLDGAK